MNIRSEFTIANYFILKSISNPFKHPKPKSPTEIKSFEGMPIDNTDLS